MEDYSTIDLRAVRHECVLLGTLGGFNGSETTDMLLRSSSTGGFEVYDSATTTSPTPHSWAQVMGFGNFSSRGENDMILRNVNTGGVEVYDLSNNQITGAAFMGTVGLNWHVRTSRKAEPEELPFLRSCHRTLCLVDLELELLPDEARDALHHPLARAFTADVNVTIIRIANKAMPTAAYCLQ
jgi:hypothetical protein